MANSISLAQKFLPLLDEVYRVNARTSVLDARKVDFTGANTVKVFKISMSGLGDYARNTGFVEGDVTGTWETMTLSKDRGRSFMVDSMDNEETAGQAFGALAGEFIRTKVVPEIDAYTFAKLAGTTGISSANADITAGTTDVAALIDAAEKQLNEDEVPLEGRILFVSEPAYSGLKTKLTRTIMNGDGGLNNEVQSYNNMRIIRVPQNRFNTTITLYDGKTTGQTDGGYIVAKDGYKINFMIVHPSAVVKVVKHQLPRIFAPGVNQKADAWKFDYRIYHDTFVYENKVDGIYMHHATTANT